MAMPAPRKRSSAAPTRSPQRPPPAAGLIMARKVSFTGLALGSWRFFRTTENRELKAKAKSQTLDLHHSRPRRARPNLRCQFSALDLQRCRPRKIFLPQQIPAHALEVGQSPVARHNLIAHAIVELLILLQPHHQHQHLVAEGLLRPQ